MYSLEYCETVYRIIWQIVFYQGEESIVTPLKYLWCWGIAAIFLFAVVAGCEQAKPDLTKQKYSGGNIIKNGSFDEELLYWGTIEGEGKGGRTM